MSRFAFLIFLLIAGAGAASAQTLFEVPDPTDLALWTVEPETDAARPGQATAVVLSVDLTEGWKMYALGTAAGKPLSVTFDTTAHFFPSPELTQERVEVGYDPNFDTDVTYFTPDSRLRFPLTVALDAPAGAHPFAGSLEFMLCNDRVCLPPTRIPLDVEIRVVND